MQDDFLHCMWKHKEVQQKDW